MYMSKNGIKTLLVGCGRAGLGLIYPLFNEAGYNSMFITDCDKRRLDILARGYIRKTPNKVFKMQPTVLYIEDVKDNFDLIVTSVGRNNLKDVANWYYKKNFSAPVILAENLQQPDNLFPQKIPIFIDRICSKTIIENKTMTVITEDYCNVSVLEHLLTRPLASVNCVKLESSEKNIELKNKHKIFTVNTSHVICALYGMREGYTFIEEAVRNPDIVSELKNVMLEIGYWFNFNPKEIQRRTNEIITRLSSPIQDPVSRILGPGKHKSALRYIEIPLDSITSMGLRAPSLEKAYKSLKKQINN
jgi:hypothetical protein